MSERLYGIAALLALELNQLEPGDERVAARARFDAMVDMEIKCAALNLAAADSTIARLLHDAGLGVQQ